MQACYVAHFVSDPGLLVLVLVLVLGGFLGALLGKLLPLLPGGGLPGGFLLPLLLLFLLPAFLGAVGVIGRLLACFRRSSILVWPFSGV